MKITILVFAAAVFGRLSRATGAASAAPIGPNRLRANASGITQVRMTLGERMMRKRMTNRM